MNTVISRPPSTQAAPNGKSSAGPQPRRQVATPYQPDTSYLDTRYTAQDEQRIARRKRKQTVFASVMMLTVYFAVLFAVVAGGVIFLAGVERTAVRKDLQDARKRQTVLAKQMAAYAGNAKVNQRQAELWASSRGFRPSLSAGDTAPLIGETIVASNR